MKLQLTSFRENTIITLRDTSCNCISCIMYKSPHFRCPRHNIHLCGSDQAVPFYWVQMWSHAAKVPACRWLQAIPEPSLSLSLTFGSLPLRSPSHLLLWLPFPYCVRVWVCLPGLAFRLLAHTHNPLPSSVAPFAFVHGDSAATIITTQLTFIRKWQEDFK